MNTTQTINASELQQGNVIKLAAEHYGYVAYVRISKVFIEGNFINFIGSVFTDVDLTQFRAIDSGGNGGYLPADLKIELIV